MIWVFLYVAGFLISWIPLVRIMHHATPPRDTEDEFVIVVVAGLAALVWPFAASVALVWQLMFNRNRQEK